MKQDAEGQAEHCRAACQSSGEEERPDAEDQHHGQREAQACQRPAEPVVGPAHTGGHVQGERGAVIGDVCGDGPGQQEGRQRTDEQEQAVEPALAALEEDQHGQQRNDHERAGVAGVPEPVATGTSRRRRRPASPGAARTSPRRRPSSWMSRRRAASPGPAAAGPSSTGPGPPAWPAAMRNFTAAAP